MTFERGGQLILSFRHVCTYRWDGGVGSVELEGGVEGRVMGSLLSCQQVRILRPSLTREAGGGIREFSGVDGASVVGDVGDGGSSFVVCP